MAYTCELVRRHAQPTDPPFVAYHAIPASRAAECVHVGPCAELHAADRALEAWMAEHDHQRGGPAFPFEANDPGDTAPADLRTRVVQLVRSGDGVRAILPDPPQRALVPL